MRGNRIALDLPPWLAELNRAPRRFAGLPEAMAFAVDAARRNIADGGGPFGALVVDDGLRLVAVGANRVVPLHGSILHAEMLALLLAQRRLGSHDLASLGDYSLVTSCAPCAMCLGAIPFAGVRRVLCGARGEDAEAIGFDEGDKPERWADKLRARGIAVEEDLGRDGAVAVLNAYRAGSGVIY
ncbi:MAG: nucleoside deaminase [Pseudomonadota bacterium]|nr:nucleoside deaminase [Pseudomonadota bacterium]